MTTPCGFRTVVKILKQLNDILGWNYTTLPNHNTIENWVKKSGYSVYKNSAEQHSKQEYVLITDESMMIGSQKMLLILCAEAYKIQEGFLKAQDVQVVGIHVRESWKAKDIEEVLKQLIEKKSIPPQYIISDNAGIFRKAIEDSEFVHIRDIGHSIAMFLERSYKKEEDFCCYMKELSKVKFAQIMNPVAYLLPPRQRTLARFMNLEPVIKWSHQIVNNYRNLSYQEQQTFGFVLSYVPLIQELEEVIESTKNIANHIKHKGFTPNTLTNLLPDIKTIGRGNKRMIGIAEQIITYLRQEIQKLPEQNNCWHGSSDIIESLFGKYKTRRAMNPLCGVTSYVLMLPLYTKLSTTKKFTEFDFKEALQQNTMADINNWAKTQLPESLYIKRKYKLAG